jgi:hypothetical protein
MENEQGAYLEFTYNEGELHLMKDIEREWEEADKITLQKLFAALRKVLPDRDNDFILKLSMCITYENHGFGVHRSAMVPYSYLLRRLKYGTFIKTKYEYKPYWRCEFPNNKTHKAHYFNHVIIEAYYKAIESK